MSLTMMAIRICAVQALKTGGTLVGDNVLDSKISPFDHTADGGLKSDQQSPFIAVYTDAARTKDLGQSGLRSNGQIEIMFNYGVSLAMSETNKETGEADIVEGFPATDEQFEAVLDALDVQIARVLTDPDNPWAQAFGGFIQHYAAKDHVRSSSKGEHVRLAAGQTKLTAEVFADPKYGQPLTEDGPWQVFMALMSEYNIAQLPLFTMLLGDATSGAYADYEKLTGMSTRVAEVLRLYTYEGVPVGAVISDPEAAAVPAP